MIRKLTLALVAAAAMGAASPALAQASYPNTSSLGTGDLLQFAYPVTTEHSARQAQYPAVRTHRAHVAGAYAYEPAMRINPYSDSPIATGGGTFGYNQGLVDPNY